MLIYTRVCIPLFRHGRSGRGGAESEQRGEFVDM
jgi:hypothetical protein